jgi:hypothetical protein
MIFPTVLFIKIVDGQEPQILSQIYPVMVQYRPGSKAIDKTHEKYQGNISNYF